MPGRVSMEAPLSARSRVLLHDGPTRSSWRIGGRRRVGRESMPATASPRSFPLSGRPQQTFQSAYSAQVLLVDAQHVGGRGRVGFSSIRTVSPSGEIRIDPVTLSDVDVMNLQASIGLLFTHRSGDGSWLRL